MCSQPSGSRLALLKGRNGLLQVHGVPEDDRGNNEIEPTGLVLQILPEPAANSAATAPLARKIFSHPAFWRASSCKSGFWSAVETRV
jgi:hypothetical protein